ncbi:MAG: 5-formyltetrahydrofolate cyclo-ligase [bacterium]
MDLSKSELRREAVARRDAQSAVEVKEKSYSIEQLLFDYEPFAAAKCVMFYYSFRSEVRTAEMIRRALGENKKVCLPKVNREKRELEIYFVSDPESELIPGIWGILEPDTVRCQRAHPEDLNVIICPGTAFDRAGNRLGYGGGYYDRFMRSVPERIHFIGLAFSVQIFDEIPASESDVKVHTVVTEDEIILPG